eukprot:ANDGO_04465.mRNA.1 Hsp70 nucleotide exchange factor FES1
MSGSQQPNLGTLFTWAVENSDPSELQRRKENFQQIDKKWMDALFPDDFKKMKECMAVIENVEAGDQARMMAAEDLELMCESIDNSNDLHKMDGITRLLKIVDVDLTNVSLSTTAFDLKLAVQCLSIFQTCMGNNRDFAERLLSQGDAIPVFSKFIFEIPTRAISYAEKMEEAAQDADTDACAGADVDEMTLRTQQQRFLFMKAISCLSGMCNASKAVTKALFSVRRPFVETGGLETGIVAALLNTHVLVIHEKRALFALVNMARSLPRDFLFEVARAGGLNLLVTLAKSINLKYAADSYDGPIETAEQPLNAHAREVVEIISICVASNLEWKEQIKIAVPDIEKVLLNVDLDLLENPPCNPMLQ